jgi:hypothetical protein
MKGKETMKRSLIAVKFIAIAAFMVTLSTMYFVRSEVLDLSKIRYSSENVRADEQLRNLQESHPVRMMEYELQMKHYDLQMKHYHEMLELYRSDYDEYVKRIQDRYRPPQLPQQPQKPRSPEVGDQLATINAAFRAQQHRYFDVTSKLNWVSCVSALTLVGGLLLLIMFETGNQRAFYLIVLVLSFVFMIGPSFHSIMSAIVGLLRAPPIY